MTWFFNVSKKSMIRLPASVGVHLYFLLQADIKELAPLQCAKHVFIFTYEQIQAEKNNHGAYVCVSE